MRTRLFPSTKISIGILVLIIISPFFAYSENARFPSSGSLDNIRKQFFSEKFSPQEIKLVLGNKEAIQIALEDGAFKPEIKSFLYVGSAKLVRRGLRNQRFYTVPASATVSESSDGINVSIRFAIQTRQKRIRFYKVIKNLQISKAPEVAAAPEYVLKNKICASDLYRLSLGTVGQNGDKAAAAFDEPQVVEIATDADRSFTTVLGSSLAARQKAAELVNVADAYYRQDLNLRLSLKQQSAQTTDSFYPTSITDPLDYLERFRSIAISQEHLGDADIYALFTGRDFLIEVNGQLGRILGLAYDIGAVCSPSNTSYTFIYRSNDVTDGLTVAHEFGHLFGASHVSGGIMRAVEDGTPVTGFSQDSISQIATYVSAHDSCLTSGEETTPTPTPVPTVTAEPTTVATPTKTPTVPAGGGGGGGTGGTVPIIEIPVLTGKLTRQKFEGQLSLPSSLVSCNVKLRAAKQGALLQFGRVIGSMVASAEVISIQASFKKSATPDKKGKAKVCIVAEVACTGEDSAFSDSLCFDASKPKFPRTSIANWIKGLSVVLE